MIAFNNKNTATLIAMLCAFLMPAVVVDAWIPDLHPRFQSFLSAIIPSPIFSTATFVPTAAMTPAPTTTNANKINKINPGQDDRATADYEVRFGRPHDGAPVTVRDVLRIESDVTQGIRKIERAIRHGSTAPIPASAAARPVPVDAAFLTRYQHPPRNPN